MIRHPPRSTRTDPLFPYTTLFRSVTDETLDKAIVEVINLYNKFELPGYWGSGKSASADGTKWSVYEQNLLSEYHIRYGGYGGIGYYQVSDKYNALFNPFIPYGVHEEVYILDGRLANRSDIPPDRKNGAEGKDACVRVGLGC